LKTEFELPESMKWGIMENNLKKGLLSVGLADIKLGGKYWKHKLQVL
jgi:hypothetical protein